MGEITVVLVVAKVAETGARTGCTEMAVKYWAGGSRNVAGEWSMAGA